MNPVKALLLKAIFFILFGMVSTSEKIKNKSWNCSKDYYGEIGVWSYGKNIKIKRNFETDEVLIQDITEKRPRNIFHGKASLKGYSDESHIYREFLVKTLGTADSDVFRNTTCVFQMEIKIKDNRLTDELRKILTGASSMDYIGIEQKMISDLEELTTKSVLFKRPKKIERLIEKLETKIKNNEEELKETENQNKEMFKIRESVEEKKVQQIEIQEVYKSRDDLYKKLLHLLDLIAEERNLKNAVANIEKTLSRSENIVCEVDCMEKIIETDYREIAMLPDDFEIRIKLALQIQNELMSLEEELEKRKINSRPWWSFSMSFFIIFLILAGILAFAVAKHFIISEVAKDILRGFGVLAGFCSLLILTKAYLKNREKNRYSEYISLKFKKLQEKLKEAYLTAGIAFNSQSSEDILGQWKKFKEIKNNIEINIKALDMIKDSNIHDQYQSVFLDLKLCRERIDELLANNEFLVAYKDVPLDRTTIELSSLSRHLNKIKKDGDLIESEIQKLEMKQRQLIPTCKNSQTYVEDIEYDNLLLERYRKRQGALELAIITLRESRIKLEKDYGKSIENNLGKAFAGFTENRYINVEFSKNSEIRVLPSNYDKSVSPEMLSCGAQDQLYLLLRSSLSERLSKGSETAVPMFFDDVLVNFDLERHRKAMEYIQSLSRNHQIFYFTHDRERMKGLDSVLDLNRT
ncbi:MAG: hypothetical protein P9M03_02990 [Candidatus Theseobacter exili]|nr:hypothetical protein [Candidatus Theseobacter exili]